MQLGSFEVPEIRLIPNAIADIKIIYDHVQSEPARSKDLAAYLGYAHATATRFYLRLNAMTVYGLLEGRGSYKVSELGKQLAYPESDEQETEARTKAVLNVALWREIHSRYKKSPPRENFWVHIKNITGIEPKKAQDIQSLIFKWYTEDIAHVSDRLSTEESTVSRGQGEPKDLSFEGDNTRSVSQQILQPTDGVEVISFDKYQVSLPKGDLAKEWETLQEYMKIKLKNYKYEEPTAEQNPQTE